MPSPSHIPPLPTVPPAERRAEDYLIAAAMLAAAAASRLTADRDPGRVVPGALVLPKAVQSPAVMRVVEAAFADRGLTFGPAAFVGAAEPSRP